MDNKIQLIYCTVSSKNEAQYITQQLLEKKLIGCATFFSTSSMYWWQETIEQDDEYILLIKTCPDFEIEVRKVIESIHSYSVPCILSINCQANESYADFMQKSVNV